MVMTILKRAVAVLMKKPLKLWGISLLSIVLIALANALFGIIPGIGLALTILLSTAMTMIYLKGYRGEEQEVTNLFDCFRSWDTAKRVVLGTAWTWLWIFLWGLIPIAGPVFAIIRIYEYRLTPYILVTEPDVPLLDAYKVSRQRTQGYKAKMFGAEVLVWVGITVGSLVLTLLTAIPVLGVLFGLANVVFSIAVAALSPLLMGLIQAAFYEEITHPTVALPVTPGASAGGYCASCGAALPEDAAFCPNCGAQK